MSRLDINTPCGQLTLEDERDMLMIIMGNCPNYSLVGTLKHEAATIDGVIVKDNNIIAAYEGKGRDMTLRQLQNWNMEWLVTLDKILGGAEVAKRMCVPLIGYLYLIPDKLVLSIRLTDKDGNLLPRIRVERTETQATCNGGQIVRTNAYIDMSQAREFV